MGEDQAKILIVDDEKINIDLLVELLKSEYRTVVAKSGPQALKRLEAGEPPDLVLLDVMMPEMDGYEVCRRIRENFLTKSIPVIFITALTDVADETKGFQVGAVDYIAKPFSPPLVEARVRTHVELKRNRDLLEALSKEDGLTGLANRRRFDEFLEFEWSRAKRRQGPISLCMLDIDYFKPFNDNYGHAAGDACLRRVGAVLKASMHRAVDLVARYGGEEFACILPDTDGPGAMGVGARLLEAIRGVRMPHAHSRTADIITLSIGVATVEPTADMEAHQLIEMADQGLYAAKGEGRNRVVFCDEMTHPG